MEPQPAAQKPAAAPLDAEMKSGVREEATAGSQIPTKTEMGASLRSRPGSPETTGAVSNEKQSEGATSSHLQTDSVMESKDHDNGDDGPEEARYLEGWKIAVVGISLAMAVFCLGLDNTIITTAIPKITDQFHALQDVGWYGSSFLLTMCSFQLIWGKIYSVFDSKYSFLAAVSIFEIGSAVCGAAPSSTSFIIGRALAGLGGAGIFTGSVLIINQSVPLTSTPLYHGLMGIVYGGSSIAGPLLGGVFTENQKLTWRWCFYLNLPLGLVTLVTVFFLVKSKPSAKSELSIRARIKELDLLGTALLLPCIILFILSLSWGGTQYPWNSARVIVCLVVSILLLIAFCVHQKLKDETGIVPPRIIKNRDVYGAAFFAMMLGGAYFTMVYYLPIWFQVVKEVSAMKSGIMSIPLICGTLIMRFACGIFTTITGYYTHFFYISVVFMSIGNGLCTTLKVGSGPSAWILYQLLAGIGFGVGLQQPIVVTQACLATEDVAVGTGIVMFASTMGGAVMLSVGQNIFTNKLVRNVGEVTKSFDPRVILVTGATELRKIAPPAVYPAVLVAYSKAITDTFYVALALSILAIFGAICMRWKRMVNVKDEKATVSPA